MNLKKLTISYVKNRQFEKLLELVKENKRAVKYLYYFLYETNPVEKWNGIEAFGYLTKELAAKDSEFFRDIIRRFLWMMNEEGGNNVQSAPEVIAEMIYNQPQLYGDLTPMMITAGLEEIFFYKSTLTGIAIIGELLPEQVYLFEDEIIELLEFNDPEVKGMAAKAIGISKLDKAIPVLEKMTGNDNVIELYFKGRREKISLGDLAKEAISAIKNIA